MNGFLVNGASDGAMFLRSGIRIHFRRCLVRKFEEIGGELHFLNETQRCSSWEFDKTYYDWTLIREVSIQIHT